MRHSFVIPKKPVELSWDLPKEFAKEDAGKFVEEARQTLARLHATEVSTIVCEDGKDYLNLDVCGITFPGYLYGATLDNGKPALNVYEARLTERGRRAVQAYMRLLMTYGAEIQWALLETTQTELQSA
jgi:hypothetical protein